MLRNSLTILAILALVAVVPAVAFAGNGNGVDEPIRAQLQVDPGTCDGTGIGFGYGLKDGSELAPAPGDGTGFGAIVIGWPRCLPICSGTHHSTPGAAGPSACR